MCPEILLPVCVVVAFDTSWSGKALLNASQTAALISVRSNV
jgi:hypothetical protein